MFKLYSFVSGLSSLPPFLLFTVTIARAIELKHNATLIAALAFETANFYQKAGQCFGTCDFEDVCESITVLAITSLFT